MTTVLLAYLINETKHVRRGHETAMTGNAVYIMVALATMFAWLLAPVVVGSYYWQRFDRSPVVGTLVGLLIALGLVGLAVLVGAWAAWLAGSACVAAVVADLVHQTKLDA